MASRIVIEEPCEHGRTAPHGEWSDRHSRSCPGGSRRVLTEGEYVLIEKVDGEWPWHGTITQGWEASKTQALYEWLDALAGGES